MRAGLWVLVCVVGWAVSCKNNNSSNALEFYYYPAKNVYYNPKNDRYYYSLNGGKSWDSVLNKSNDEPAILGERVLVTGNDYRIYKHNQEHRAAYSGVVFDFKSTAAATAVTSVAERKIERKPVVKKEPPKKEKKGIGKFFSKLFGKKKD